MFKNKNLRKTQVIVSLTSFPARINTVHKTIQSLLEQTFKADKIILWLANEQFPNMEKDLPKDLLKLIEKGLEIAWCEDIKSYKKIMPTLKKYPNSVIITTDDDVIYPKDCLEILYNTWLKNPKCAICNRGHRIKLDDNKKILPYKKWERKTITQKSSYSVVQTGVGAVLYPPNCFYKDVLNKELYSKLSKNTDDLWLWAMLVLNDRKIKRTNVPPEKYYEVIDGTQEIGLWDTVNANGGNDINLQLIIDYYPRIMKKIIVENRNIKKYLQTLFSIKNKESKNSQWYKVITILGIKLKIKNKDLTQRKQLLALQERINAISSLNEKQLRKLDNKISTLTKLLEQ